MPAPSRAACSRGCSCAASCWMRSGRSAATTSRGPGPPGGSPAWRHARCSAARLLQRPRPGSTAFRRCVVSERNGTAIARSVLAGVLSGMRSAAGPTLAVWQLRDVRASRRDRLARRLLAGEHAPQVAAVLAAGELLADKYPRIPNRTAPPALLARAAAGALAAAALVPRRASARVVLAHALIGAGAAVLS